MRSSRSAVWGFAFWAFACGGRASDSANAVPSTGGNATEGNGSEATGTGGSTGSTDTGSDSGNIGGDSGNGAGGRGGSGGDASPNVCEGFDDEPASHVEVVIANQSSKVIYLGPFSPTCSEQPRFSIERDGNSIAYFDDPCDYSCEQVRDYGAHGCPAICYASPTLQLAPGETHAIHWNGLVREERTLPVACVEAEFGPESDARCYQGILITPGTYTFAATAGTELNCEDTVYPGNCGPCEEVASGGCVYTWPRVGGETLQAETEIELGAAHGIPEPGTEPGGTTSPIEIVFSD